MDGVQTENGWWVSTLDPGFPLDVVTEISPLFPQPSGKGSDSILFP